MPDGEVGERKSWVNRLSYQVFNGHIDLETIRRPQRVNGVEQLLPRGRDDTWQFKVRDGVDIVRFGNPGSRLGYAKDAAGSYFVFKTLREMGVLPQNIRFQISIPMVIAWCGRRRFRTRATWIKSGWDMRKRSPQNLMPFLDNPHDDLAVQWDCALGGERRL